jgi:uncharacterized protein
VTEPPEPKRPMTLSEAGRKGGEKVKRERGPDFYAEIGRKGGRRVAQDHGPSFYSEIGKKGGEARRSEGRETPVAEDEDAPARRPPLDD